MFIVLTFFSSAVSKVLGIVLALVIGGYIATKRANRIEVQFRKLAGDLNLRLTRSTEDFGFDILQLDGTIDGYRVQIVNSPVVGKRKEHAVNIRVYTRSKKVPEFYLKKVSKLGTLLPSVLQNDIKTGNELFDIEFKLTGRNEDEVLCVFDSVICSEFSSNAESFKDTEIRLHDGELFFDEIGQVRTSGQRERILELVPFLVRLTEKADNVVAKKMVQ